MKLSKNKFFAVVLDKKCLYFSNAIELARNLCEMREKSQRVDSFLRGVRCYIRTEHTSLYSKVAETKNVIIQDIETNKPYVYIRTFQDLPILGNKGIYHFTKWKNIL